MNSVLQKTEIQIEVNEKIRNIDNAVIKLIEQANGARLKNIEIKESYSDKFFKSVKDYL